MRAGHRHGAARTIDAALTAARSIDDALGRATALTDIARVQVEAANRRRP